MTESAKQLKAQEPEETNPVALAWEHYAVKWEADTGRPTIYGKEIAAACLADLMRGETVRAICAKEDRPGVNTFYVWMNRHPEFKDAVHRARELQAHQFADMALECGQEALNSLTGDRSDVARIGAYKIKYESLRWRAGVQNKQYAEKQTVTHEVSSDTAKLLMDARERIKTLDGSCKRVED